MINTIIQFSVRNKLIVILFTLTIAAYGIYAVLRIPVGAVPDITNNQVQVITTSGNLATQDVEQFLTYPVELEMSNLPGVKEIRSISKFGLSVVTIVFEDDLGTYLPRQLIAEKLKLAAANIPEGFGSPEMGPITTGLGEIYQYILDVKPGYEGRYSATELRTIQDWIVKRQLSGIRGVVEVNTWGGYLKQYEVSIHPGKLKQMNVTLREVYEALSRNNHVAGGAYIEKQNKSYFIRGDGMVGSLDDIRNIVVRNTRGTPVYIKDVAQVGFGHANRYGAITGYGEGEKVLGQIMMLKNANSKEVISEVKKRVEEVQKNLPEGVFINPILERSELIGKTSFTVAENLILGCLIVMLIVILLLGNLRSALVIASMIPLALLFTISMMYIFGIDANLMSLGALDFGIIIDGAVIIVEFIAIRITASKPEYEASSPENRRFLLDRITFDGASRMINSAIFGQVIILIVLIPIFALSGVEGKMFRPMALSFSFAILGAMILGLTWLPVASAMFLRPEKENHRSVSKWIMKWVYRSYRPVIQWSYDHKRYVLGLALFSLLLTVFLFSRMGGEFVPTLDEGDFVIQPVLKTGTSLSKTIELTTRMENILISKFPEVDKIVCRIGAAEVPTDPMSMEEIDMIIKLKPRREWVSAESKEALADRFKEALMVIPGIDYEFTQPIEMRFNELITGVRADIAVKIFGEDLDYLNEKAIEAKELIDGIPGAADVILEKTAGLPQMGVRYKRDRIAYYGLNIEDVNSQLSMAFGGMVAGSVFEGEKKFDLVIRLGKEYRSGIDDLRQLNIGLPDGSQKPLSELASIDYTTGPAKISRENTHRRVVVSVNVRNRDLQSVVKDIEAKLDKNLKLKPGNYIVYGGQFENLQNATRRLQLAVPVALLLIFIFLHFAFQSLRDAALIFTAVPLSAVGGVLFLWIRGMPFSVSAGIGFIALFGVAVLNGIVLIEHLKELRKNGMTDMRELVMKATSERLRPVLLTAAAAALGFLPMAISSSAGAEVQRPLATVVIGGLITSTLLTMIALPLLYSIFNKENRSGFSFRLLGKKRFRLPFLTLLILGLSLTGKGQTINLEQAIEAAIQNNKQLKAERLNLEQQKALIPSAFAIEKTNFFLGFDQNNIAENGYPLHVIGAEQSFAFPGVYLAQQKLNAMKASQSEKLLEQQEMVLKKKVSQAYYRLLILERRQHYYHSADSIFSYFTQASDLQFKHGEISYLDQLTARAKQQEIRRKIQELEAGISVAYLELESLVQMGSSYRIAATEPEEVQYPGSAAADPGFRIMEDNIRLNQYSLSVEKQMAYPSLNLSYFYGTNKYDAPNRYYGYQLGVGIPLFFGEQRSRIRSGKLSIAIATELRDQYVISLQTRRSSLLAEAEKYRKSVEYFRTQGVILSDELIRSATKSLSAGEIDYFRFAQSMEAAFAIRTDYLEDLSRYNDIVLELNYLTN